MNATSPAPKPKMSAVVFASSDQTHPLNNGFHCKFKDDNERVFVSVEQYMMWNKARMFPGNEKVANDILETADYDEIKTLGRRVVNFVPTDWEDRCFDIVKQGCLYKALCCPAMTSLLITDGPIQQTGEGAWCHPGENRLGKVLQAVRSEILGFLLV